MHKAVSNARLRERSENTRDPVNQCVLDLHKEICFERLGYMRNKLGTMTLGRPYLQCLDISSFKMLEGESTVAEIGCGDGFCLESSGRRLKI